MFVWSDSETHEDLLGFRVHANLIRSLVTTPESLPTTVGVFGDWGGGKSSIMRMLQEDFESAEYDDVVCLYFNGWQFEGYEDAKSALLSSILIQLGEHKTLGHKAKDKAVKLLRRVKWMELAKFGVKHVGVPLAAATLTGGMSAIPAAAMALGSSLLGHHEKTDKKTKEEMSWGELIDLEPGKPDVLEVRKFREDFEKMLGETDLRSLVVLVDDLDRCLPERLIETLEAIKLFVSVPKTAFIIGADPRIVRHAIATRYIRQQLRDDIAASGSEKREEEYDLVQDYLEKLIQVPYYLPRLSPPEIETYLNLLACQRGLPPELWRKVREGWEAARKEHFYKPFQQAAIRKAVTNDSAFTPELNAQLSWSGAVSQVVAEGLKGNPRQVKRMLNALSLRKQLAVVAGMEISDTVLAKLMVLEYSRLDRFRELNSWQAAEEGHPKHIRDLEQFAIHDKPAPIFDSIDRWTEPTVRSWLRIEPPLRDIDLRDYFWLARDKTNSSLVGTAMVSPVVRKVFGLLVSGKRGDDATATRLVKDLDTQERVALYGLLQAQIARTPEKGEALSGLGVLAREKMEGAGTAYLAAIKSVHASQLGPAIAVTLQTFAKADPVFEVDVDTLLKHLATFTETGVGKAAKRLNKQGAN